MRSVRAGGEAQLSRRSASGKPRRIKTAVLLDKPSRRVAKVRADYIGFDIPDLFVVGYGLDFAERYRNLPFVGVLHPHIYKEVSQHVCK